MENTSAEPLTYDVWPTAWGPIGAVWSADGLCRVILPHYQPKDLEQVLLWEHPGARRDGAAFGALAEMCQTYFRGKAVDFSAIQCSLPPEKTFAGKVLRQCRGIPYGEARSYSQLAQLIGAPDSARAVAGALGRNPIPLVVPCHRVTYADGRLGGFSSPGGTDLKARMLQLEQCRNTGSRR